MTPEEIEIKYLRDNLKEHRILLINCYDYIFEPHKDTVHRSDLKKYLIDAFRRCGILEEMDNENRINPQ